MRSFLPTMAPALRAANVAFAVAGFPRRRLRMTLVVDGFVPVRRTGVRHGRQAVVPWASSRSYRLPPRMRPRSAGAMKSQYVRTASSDC
jgi:hypothetical protein